MRPGRPEDIQGLLDLWRADVRAGRRDSIPGDGHVRSVMAGFDWDARSRIVDRAGGGTDAAVLVSSRDTPLGIVASIEASTAHDRTELLHDVVRWGMGLSRASGAVAAQVWRGSGHGDRLDQVGLELVRPWWRMDRSLLTEPVTPSPVPGYELHDARAVPASTWVEVHNLTFADHWRFSPRSEEELLAARVPALGLMALTPEGAPAALTICHVEEYDADYRPQPVGVISSVGTLPDHRRKGLATWLVAEGLVRLHRAGARHASLYVDGLNPMRPFDGYRKLGFEVAFETEVWEAVFR